MFISHLSISDPYLGDEWYNGWLFWDKHLNKASVQHLLASPLVIITKNCIIISVLTNQNKSMSNELCTSNFEVPLRNKIL